MADLEKIMTLPGALAAFEFNDKGELLKSTITDEKVITTDVLDLLCHVCVANGAIATMQARGWEKMTSMSGFYPIKGFSLMGFEWTVVVNEHAGVIVSNKDIDFDGAYAVLEG
jgi:roadblock/LC7 domain-containing protein